MFAISEYRRLARRIERSGADGVFLGGYSFNNGAALLRDLRAVLGPRFRSWRPTASASPGHPRAGGCGLRRALRERRELSAVPSSRLGAAFVDAFEEAIGGAADPYSITTAQATEVLLAAIAASDGTRAFVTEQLLQVRVKNGILGSFEFDANGDTTAGAVTMYRIEKGKPRVHAVLTPPAELLERR